MKPLIALFLLSFAAAGIQAKDDAPAKEASPARTAQQQKMKACNAEAKAGAKKGAERKAFMKECLSAKKS